MTLTEFLLARIAADEANALSAVVNYTMEWPYTPARVLAECTAKRAIIAAFVEQVESYGVPWDAPNERLWPEFGGGYLMGLREAVQLLAAPYSSQPDFDAAWGTP